MTIGAIVGRHLKSYRQHFHLTQGQLARESGVSQAQISRLEAGHASDLSVKTLLCLTSQLGLRISGMFAEFLVASDRASLYAMEERLQHAAQQRAYTRTQRRRPRASRSRQTPAPRREPALAREYAEPAPYPRNHASQYGSRA
jgi:transcriptional regulator with XRE-family HTH domain